MNAKVSVIVPIYNSSRYIERCCRSLFGQTLDALQFIFVDDGSDDGSIETVKLALSDYPNRADQSVFISYRSNKGVGSARHAGIERATGVFVIHCDSDDWVEPDTYQLLYDKAISTNADVVTCGYVVDTDSGQQKRIVSAFQKDSDNFSFDISPQIGSLFLKLIRREFLLKHHLQVPEGIDWGEDLCLSLESLLLASKVETVDAPLYHYVQHEDSLTHNVTTESCLSLVKCGSVVEKFLQERNLTSRYSFQLNWLKFQLKQYFLVFPQTRDILRWKSITPECHQDILSYQTMFYLKMSSWFIVHRMEPIASIVLGLRDMLSSIKNR